MNDPQEPLSERELEILRLVATGVSNKEIASALQISPNTVKVHLRNIFTKIGVVSRTEATLYAIRSGLVSSGAAEQAIVEAEESPQDSAAQPDPTSPLSAAATLPLSSGPTAAAPTEAAPRRLPRRWWLILTAASLVVLAGLAIFFAARQPAPQAALQPTALAAPAQTLAPRWAQDADLPGPRASLGAFLYNNAFYLLGGTDGQAPSRALYRYEPQTRLWMELAPKPTSASGIKAVLIGEKVYVPGGTTANGQPSAMLEVYDPRLNQWTSRKPIPLALSQYGAAAFEGRLYLFGGWDGSGYSDKVFVYDPLDDSWGQASSLPSGRARLAVEAFQDRIIVAGGYDGSKALTDVLFFLPSRDMPGDSPWSAGPSLSAGRYGMSSASLASMVFLFGGKGDQEGAALPPSMLHSEAKDWAQIDSSPLPLTFDGAALAAGNFIHLFGGELESGPIARHIAYQAIYTISIPFTNTQ